MTRHVEEEPALSVQELRRGRPKAGLGAGRSDSSNRNDSSSPAPGFPMPGSTVPVAVELEVVRRREGAGRPQGWDVKARGGATKTEQTSYLEPRPEPEYPAPAV